MKRLSLMVSEPLFERIELARGDVPRERWLRRAVERALEGLDRTPSHGLNAGDRDPVPAPAEQLEKVDRILTSVAREFRPYPKGGKR